ncbi:MAG: ChaN family lipoprotein, partial [Bacteroidales bacterium]|nr:ChaN family lipoprotein [Bacteroidales bacterium]
ICHWLQLELTKDLYASLEDNFILGAEMFESDNQMLLDEYLSDRIKTKNFEDEMKMWKNYKTDYKPLVEFAKENGIAFVATNIPRRYAALVHKEGFEALENLSEEAKKLIPPLPVLYNPELEVYKSMMEMKEDMKMGGHNMPKPNPNLPKAQAIKDATMAYFILQNFEDGKTFLHFNGTAHSDNYEGIAWYIKQAKPELKIFTIASVEQDTISELTEENLGLADAVLCVSTTMTKTY